ncbi:shikimate kinase [Pedobacter sp. MR2016-24]|uniref:shikimate kinase n=1 Tax=Pedobacter sp. MR2016-24 TaxID=2994466 RepID=UPI002245FC74|nr:shikimate kinase [Pedobacter sp. MR2016-24]MCX2485460.1 AAA family ATPase [Pedobacter sp. MR2016-24]
MKIFLIGFMGCGKSTLGKKLATKMGYHLIDLDQRIEEVTGDTVAAYFSANGEDAFRKLESETLKSSAYPENCIIATGGGTPCYFDNMEWMNNNGTTVYIDMPAAALAKRLEAGIAKRPLLQGLSGDELTAFISDKLQSRLSFYEQSKLIMNGIRITPDAIRAAVLSEEGQV